jgi:anti-sigma28 factor (negative regulator of flagellin synthesis)
MMINRIGSINPYFLEGANHTNQANRLRDADSIRLSEEALEQSQVYQASEIVQSAPDVRDDLVEKIKAELNDPSFFSDEAYDVAAEKLLAVLGF